MMSHKKYANNFEAIKAMSVEELEALLDYIYTTGLNDGSYAAKLDDEEKKMDILGNNPYNKDWLCAEAEAATEQIFTDDDDENLPEAFLFSFFRCAGINPYEDDDASQDL